jgi:hypothetical protein
VDVALSGLNSSCPAAQPHHYPRAFALDTPFQAQPCHWLLHPRAFALAVPLLFLSSLCSSVAFSAIFLTPDCYMSLGSQCPPSDPPFPFPLYSLTVLHFLQQHTVDHQL